MKKVSLLGIIFLLVASCASNPYSKTNKLYKEKAKAYAKQLRTFPLEENPDESALHYGDYPVGTTNFNLRKPDFVVIHHTAQDSTRQTLTTFTLPRTQVSAHYVIGRDGAIYHMLNDFYRAWHGGVGKWGHTTDLNSSSIGIELDNNGKEEFSEAQINSLLDVLKELKEKFNIPAENFIGHADIAPGRKVDPSAYFPWEKLAKEGYGIWYDPQVVENLKFEEEFFPENMLYLQLDPRLTQKISFLDELLFPNLVPSNFNPKEALRIIGYNTKDLNSAIQSFKIHFILNKDYEKPISPILNARETKILFNLYQKYM